MTVLRSLAACVALLATAAPALGQALIGDGTERANTMQIHIRQPGEGPVSERLPLPLGQAAVVHLPIDAADVMVANPGVADAIVRTPRRAIILGQGVGRTNVFFFDSTGALILDLDVRIERDMDGLQDALRRFVPDGRVTAESMNSNIVLSGSVPSASAADTALQVARRWADDPEQVVSFLAVEGREQVMLKVRVVEMERNIVRQLGVNLSGEHRFGDFDAPTRVQATDDAGAPLVDSNGSPIFNVIQPGRYQSGTTFGTDNGFGVAGAALGGLTAGVSTQNLVDGVLQSSLGATLNALERVGLVRTLAEPNLTAISGEAANFLAGGEFPVPVGRDRDGNITVEFKPFGVGLGFTPVVLSEGRISLRISTEVSELSNDGALSLGSDPVVDEDGNQIGTVAGLTIPALTVNRAETTVELPSGGSLVIAGLIQEETRQALDSVPGVERLPVLGSLFRSRDFANNETELVVMVTPYLVDPADPDDLSSPGEGLAGATTTANLLLGRLNRVYAAPGARPDDRGWLGPLGFSLE
ncbi:type II and III secretion system protein [Marinicauda salina]|uniref:Type II and III secretion system protein n=1 Tax=Marinicauda salina TaxID=2135793 RepID=A0A2U2BXN0_9PROT|nr:type II and III secretion system protein family protein [Marinicauda salina]PWE18766.1 type II and III secretion system protein [Marinicauda salina]